MEHRWKEKTRDRPKGGKDVKEMTRFRRTQGTGNSNDQITLHPKRSNSCGGDKTGFLLLERVRGSLSRSPASKRRKQGSHIIPGVSSPGALGPPVESVLWHLLWRGLLLLPGWAWAGLPRAGLAPELLSWGTRERRASRVRESGMMERNRNASLNGTRKFGRETLRGAPGVGREGKPKVKGLCILLPLLCLDYASASPSSVPQHPCFVLH